MTDISLNVEAVTAIQIAMMQMRGPEKRGQHFKMHGCVDATFEVHPDLPAPLRCGLFSEAASYRAVVRFSNGSGKNDAEPDVHGMAIKLFDVPGRGVLEPSGDTTEQDFILADKPVFFIRTASDYERFMKSLAESSPQGKPPEKFIAHLKDTHPEDIPILLGFRQNRIGNPLTGTYWSQVPYSFGGGEQTICRYRAKPADAAAVDAEPGTGHDYLRERMAQRLGDGHQDCLFDFDVQVKQGADTTVIDNPTVEWDEPFVTVATIRIKAQNFDTAERNRYGEQLRYTPWHAIDAHRPVGEVNEIRKVVYLASQDLRERIRAVGRENLRLSEEELTKDIDEDFKAVVDDMQQVFNFATRIKHGRGTHTWGVAGRGRARFIVSPDFPANDYFVNGKTVPVILRHSSPGAREDDRARDGVAASVKFFEPGTDYSGPGTLDVLMNAGRQLFVRSIRDFATFVHADPAERKRLTEVGVMMEPELIEAYRIRGSFLDSRYHSWQCFEFRDADDRLSYLRFRLIPGDRGPERGLPAKEFRANGLPSMDPVPDDPRAPDFLRQEWIYQVKYSEVRYILQAQLHPAAPADEVNPEALNPAKAWDEQIYPWMDLCEITIEEPIVDNEVVSALDMNPNRSPHCIRMPLATSPDHYASLGQARAIIYPGVRSVRAALDKPQNN